jgi:hypothetical protein
MKILINENEKNRILNLYRPKFLFEQANYTISDLQSLIGVAVDNNLGSNTAAKLKQILSGISGNGCTKGAGGGGAGGGGAKGNLIKNPMSV